MNKIIYILIKILTNTHTFTNNIFINKNYLLHFVLLIVTQLILSNCSNSKQSDYSSLAPSPSSSPSISNNNTTASTTTSTTTTVENSSNNKIVNFQLYSLKELNLARTNPKLYAQTRLKNEYSNNKDNGAYQELLNTEAMDSLTLDVALNNAATNYAIFLNSRQLFGHTFDGTPSDRCSRAGYNGGCAENIAQASGEDWNADVDSQKAAINFIKILIIDYGVSNYGHRRIILDPSYRKVGIGHNSNSNPNSTYINLTVQNFGQD
ncbi:MAG: CAP domain-containing protein [Oligoflexia bacterium]|nr:CAP domain-containing protein [Oligoflexia bacterium]